MVNLLANTAERVRRYVARQFAPRRAFAEHTEVERAEHRFYLDYLREGMIVFDAGANVGELTLLFARFVGDAGRVHAFEASRECFARLHTICEVSGRLRRNITLNHSALAAREEIVRLHVYAGDYLGWSSLARRPFERYGIAAPQPTIEETTATTVDSYCMEQKIDRIDLLKIDVEGAEHQVLSGSRRMLGEKRIGCIAFEFGQATFDMGNTPADIKDLLTTNGYKVRNVVTGDPIFPGGKSAMSARFSMHIATPSNNRR